MPDDLLSLRVQGLEEFLGELKRVDPEFQKVMAKTHREVAKFVRDDARAAAPAAHKTAITSRADRKRASIVVKPGRKDFALVVFLGAKRRSGFYNARKYEASRGRQHRPWVGNQWEPGANSGVPYHIGAAINRSVEDVLDEYAEVIDRVARAAFPD